MQRATTPTHYFKFPKDPSTFDEILVSYSQKHVNILNKEKDDLNIDYDTWVASYTLTQEETNIFTAKDMAEVQVRVKLNDGTVVASPIYHIRIEPVINDEEL